MNNSNQLLDMYSQRLSLKTNQAIADKLGVQRPTVSMWKSGASHPNAAAIAAMCKATEESLAKWLPLIEAERCRTDADRKVWLRLAQAAAAIALIVLAQKHGAHEQIALLFAAHNPGGLYIMSNNKYTKNTPTCRHPLNHVVCRVETCAAGAQLMYRKRG